MISTSWINVLKGNPIVYQEDDDLNVEYCRFNDLPEQKKRKLIGGCKGFEPNGPFNNDSNGDTEPTSAAAAGGAQESDGDAATVIPEPNTIPTTSFDAGIPHAKEFESVVQSLEKLLLNADEAGETKVSDNDENVGASEKKYKKTATGAKLPLVDTKKDAKDLRICEKDLADFFAKVNRKRQGDGDADALQYVDKHTFFGLGTVAANVATKSSKANNDKNDILDDNANNSVLAKKTKFPSNDPNKDGDNYMPRFETEMVNFSPRFDEDVDKDDDDDDDDEDVRYQKAKEMFAKIQRDKYRSVAPARDGGVQTLPNDDHCYSAAYNNNHGNWNNNSMEVPNQQQQLGQQYPYGGAAAAWPTLGMHSHVTHNEYATNMGYVGRHRSAMLSTQRFEHVVRSNGVTNAAPNYGIPSAQVATSRVSQILQTTHVAETANGIRTAHVAQHIRTAQVSQVATAGGIAFFTDNRHYYNNTNVITTFGRPILGPGRYHNDDEMDSYDYHGNDNAYYHEDAPEATDD